MAGDHTARDRHLFGAGPKRLLSLDGGGVRGVISVAFLERIEALLSAQAGVDARLGDWFDLAGGTSTGAIIATGLALGKSTRELKDIYHQLAPHAFRRSRFRIPFLQPKFDVAGLRREIEAIVGDQTLDSPALRTGLGIVAKRVDTASLWIVANNPRAPYWETPRDGNFIGNREYKLTNLLRASTAAPTYFEPESIPILEKAHGLFIDGGVSPHNNPALALFMMTQLKPYGLCWETGRDKLTIVSIGTGGYRQRLDRAALGRMQNITVALHALKTVMDDSQGLALALMQWFGESPTPWLVNSEMQDLMHDLFPAGPLFRFLRYDVRLESVWLTEHLGVTLSEKDLARVREMDNPDSIPLAYEIGRLAAERQVKPEHWNGEAQTPRPPL
ncbi:MAG: patatin [Alphaproteobacteria bacterium]|nr:MAG: patatin [Alphaproteobacteria bacterium]